jgi:hypothetical protein
MERNTNPSTESTLRQTYSFMGISTSLRRIGYGFSIPLLVALRSEFRYSTHFSQPELLYVMGERLQKNEQISFEL